MTATVAQPSGNQFAVLLCMFLLVSAITCVVLWVHERRSDMQGDTIAEHTEQLATLAYQMPALLEYLGVDINEPVADDSPAAEAEMTRSNKTQRRECICPDPREVLGENADVRFPVTFHPDCAIHGEHEAKTDEFPVAPATVPDGMPLAVQSALIERPSPVPRGKSADWVEAELAAMRARNAERMARAVTEEAS